MVPKSTSVRLILRIAMGTFLCYKLAGWVLCSSSFASFQPGKRAKFGKANS